jgi:endonuclease YncB( thermonuclease family)
MPTTSQIVKFASALTVTIALFGGVCPAASGTAASITFVEAKSCAGPLIVVLANGEKVRLVGLDVFPTTGDPKKDEAFRREGAEFLYKLVAGKQVWLEFDGRRDDRAGNLLAYVFLKEDGTLVNAKMVEHGYAVAFTLLPYKHIGQFKSLQTSAEKGKAGIWSRYTPPPSKKKSAPAAAPAASRPDEPGLSFSTSDTRN